MQRKVVYMSTTLLERLLTMGHSIKATCVQGLPEGARFVEVVDESRAKSVDEPEGARRIGFVFECSDWLEELEGADLPIVDIEYRETESEMGWVTKMRMLGQEIR